MDSEAPTKDRVLRALGAFGLTAVTGLLGIGCWVAAREALLWLMRAISDNRYAVGAVEKFGFIVFALIWLVLVYVSGHFYQKAVASNRLGRTFARVTAGQVVFVVLAVVVYFVSRSVFFTRVTG
jgi:hypothetical protein